MSDNCVVIPLYKSVPDEWETISFTQCVRILQKHDIYIATHSDTDLSVYECIAKKNNKVIGKVFFSEIYFKDVTGYNFLMLNENFYRKFNDYKYILIYQLDCFVFADQLEEWANKGYDYIGSPWFACYKDYDKDSPFWNHGNGGFSLRNIESFLKVFDWKWPLRKMPQIKHDLRNLKMNKIQKSFLHLLIWLGYHNSIDNFWRKMGYDHEEVVTAYTDNKLRANEDVLWTNMFKYTRVTIKTPDFGSGLGFSFERSPRYLYQVNSNKLPFGCHAWWKYDLEFWKPFIESYGYKIPQI